MESALREAGKQMDVDHVALRNDDLDVQLWIAKAYEPGPRRMLMLHKDIEGRPRICLQFSDLDFSPELI
jgi:hypothetical protein